MKYVKDFEHNTQPIEIMAGTNDEVFALGQTLTLSSGLLTAAGNDSDGTQTHICMGAATGVTGVKNVPVMAIRKSAQFKTVSSATVATSLIGAAVELNADEIRVTATTTKGVFVIDETDGATTASTVVGHFTTGL